jgi:hypothetical protein
VLTNIDQVAAMSEAAAELGRRDADRWLAKAVFDVVAGEAANRAGQPSPPATATPSAPGAPPAPGRHRQGR